MRVLVTSTSGTGHVHPLVPIAAEFAARGHEVRWATQAPALDRVASYGFDALLLGSPRAEQAMPSAAAMPALPPRQLRPALFRRLFAEGAATASRPGIAAAVDEFRADLIVHEMCELAAAPVARSRGIPHVTVGFSGQPYAAMFEAARPALEPVWGAEGLDVPDDLGIYDHLYLHPWPGALGSRPAAASVHDSWHMGFDGATGTAPDWVASLGRDRPCVYVSFGTEFGPLAPWGPVLDALGRLDVDAVATTGRAVDLSAHGTVPPNVRVETYVPQRFLLDRAAVMVSHAGAGAIAATIERGIPQVCVPIAADQWDNSDAASAAGVAVVLDPDHRSTDDVAAALDTALRDAVLAERCARVRDEVAAMPSVSQVVDRMLATV